MPDARTPEAAQHYVEFDEYIDFHLARTRSQIKYTEVFTTLLAVTTLFFAYLLAFAVFDQWVVNGGFGYTARVIMLTVVLSLVTGALVRKVLLPWLKRVNALYAARVIESADPELKSSLLNVVDLRGAGKPVPKSVMKAIEKRAAVSLSHVDVDHAVDRRPLLRVSYALLGVVIVGCLYTVISPKDVFSSIRRALLPAAPIDVATQTTISEVAPGDESLPARSHLKVEADIRGIQAARVDLVYTTADHKFVDQAVEMRRIEEGQPRFRGVITGENGRGLLQDITYSITAGDARTKDFHITVIQPPSAKVEEVHYVSLPYMQIEPKTQPGGQIDGWEGATVTVTATANMPVQKAWITFTDAEDSRAKGEEQRMQVTEGTKLKAEWKLGFRSDGTYARFYHIQVETAKKERDPDPTLHSIKIRPDQPPEVALLAPTSDLEMPANAVVPLVIQAADPDFQLRFLTLRAEKAGEMILEQRLFEDRDLGQTFRGTYDFALAPLTLIKGETIQFWVEAKDNKQPTANRKNTPRLNIRIVDPVSPKEAQQQLAQEKQKQQDQLAQADERNNEERPDPQPRDPGKPEEPQKPGDKGAAPEQKQDGNDKDTKEPNNPKEPGRAGPDDPQQKGNAAQKKPRSDGSDDPEVLRELLNREQQNQPPDKQNKPSPDGADPKTEQKPNPSPDNKSGDKNNAGQPQPGKNDANASPKPGDQKKHGETPKTEKEPGKKPEQPNDPGKGDNPNAADKPSTDKGEPKHSAKDPSQDKPAGANPPPDKSDKPNAGQPGKKMKPDSDKGPEKKEGGKKGDGSDEKGKPGEGKPDASDKPGANSPENQPATGGKPAPAPDDKKPGGKAGDPNLKGEEKPAADSPDAVKKPATGDEKGPASPGDKGEPGTAKAKNDLERKPGEPSAAKKEPGDTDPKSAEPGKQPKSGDPSAKRAGNDAKEAKPATETKNNPRQEGNPDETPSARPKTQPNNPAEKKAGQPDAGNDDLKGPGRKQGQNSDQPQGGEAGGSKQNDQGNQGGTNSGAGDKSKKPGAADKADKPNGGQSGDAKGPGSKTQPSQKGEISKPGAGESTKPAGKPGSEPGKGGSDKSDAPAGQQSGKGASQDAPPGNGPQAPGKQGSGVTGQPKDAAGNEPGGGSRGGPNAGDGSGEGDPAAAEAAEKANLEYAKKATNLVLKRLKDELDRGEVDQDLLDKLGWNKDDMARFVKRLENQVGNTNPDDNSPEATARRLQFEETLKSLQLGSETKRRTGDPSRDRRTRQIDARRLPVPAEFREQLEAYTKGLSKQPAAAEPKK